MTRMILPHSPATTTAAIPAGTSSSRTLSLIVPVLNEEEVVPVFLKTIEPLVVDLHSRIQNFEVVFVDDGSTDQTIEVIQTYKSDVLDIRIVKLSRNFRKDNAMAAGLAYATGDAVIPMDVDLQDPPELIPRMVDAWLEGAKIVNARRSSREADSWLKKSTSTMFYRVFNKLADYKIESDVGDFRLLDKQVVSVLNDMPERVRFMKGMFSWVGFHPVTLEYERPQRAAGETKWNIWKLWNFALDGITGSTTLPLRAWTYLGTTIGFVALLMGVLLVVRTLVFGIDVPGYASLMVVVLFFGALNLIALGVMGEYIGRLTVESKNRPIYIVDEVIEVKAAGDTKRASAASAQSGQSGSKSK